ncbi:MAG: DNA mismatch repair endonuclease MutL [Mogibacterium sp.]|nr:DNA mismatch repair endonuclease MutL [Mogibacterium sp.]
MIRVLDPHTADRIAAGEVIERPLSIVKELIENAIDAGAKSIITEIRGGGKSYIRVTDDGTGIAEDEVELAFERHATGKIRVLEDLDHLATLGFRGEALPSIAAISRLTLYTRTADAAAGTRLELHGGRRVAKEPAGTNKGTTMIVEDVFYNTPARRKFMRSDAAEASAIIDLVQRLAIYYSSIAFRLINNGQTILTTAGDGDTLQAIRSVYPDPEHQELIGISYGCVRGYISDPGTTRSNRSGQLFFVNGRIVRSDVIEKGLRKGYGDRLFSGYPVAILFLTVDPERIDVNIHPGKLEIKFLDAKEIVEEISTAVRTVMATEQSVPSQTAGTSEEESPRVPAEKTEQLGIREFLQHGPQETPSHAEPDSHNSYTQLLYDSEKAAGQAAERPEPYTASGQEKTTEAVHAVAAAADAAEGTSLFAPIRIAPPGTRLFRFEDLTVKGYVFRTYIITQAGDTLYVLDQHAAHERILYEKLLTQYERGDHTAQQMLVPILLNVSGDVYHSDRDWLQVLRRLGYEIDDFGLNTFRITGIPSYMDRGEAEVFARRLVESDDLPEIRNRTVADKLIMRSCKAAIKGNDELSEGEIADLLDQLSKCVNPFSCPHGRPTFIRITKYEIERAFRRR